MDLSVLEKCEEALDEGTDLYKNQDSPEDSSSPPSGFLNEDLQTESHEPGYQTDSGIVPSTTRLGQPVPEDTSHGHLAETFFTLPVSKETSQNYLSEALKVFDESGESFEEALQLWEDQRKSSLEEFCEPYFYLYDKPIPLELSLESEPLISNGRNMQALTHEATCCPCSDNGCDSNRLYGSTQEDEKALLRHLKRHGIGRKYFVWSYRAYTYVTTTEGEMENLMQRYHPSLAASDRPSCRLFELYPGRLRCPGCHRRFGSAEFQAISGNSNTFREWFSHLNHCHEWYQRKLLPPVNGIFEGSLFIEWAACFNIMTDGSDGSPCKLLLKANAGRNRRATAVESFRAIDCTVAGYLRNPDDWNAAFIFVSEIKAREMQTEHDHIIATRSSPNPHPVTDTLTMVTSSEFEPARQSITGFTANTTPSTQHSSFAHFEKFGPNR